MTMPTDAIVRRKVCSSCGQPFDCSAGGCWCDDIPLTPDARATLRTNFVDCLCPTCLRRASDGTLGAQRRQHQSSHGVKSRWNLDELPTIVGARF
jgi:hypothetical protein